MTNMNTNITTWQVRQHRIISRVCKGNETMLTPDRFNRLDYFLEKDDRTHTEFYKKGFTRADAERAVQEGRVLVYSLKPIEQGSQVCTTRHFPAFYQAVADDRFHNPKIYWREINLDDLAFMTPFAAIYTGGDEI